MPTRNDEEVLGHTTGATDPMPVIGSVIVVMGRLYRCVSVTYADSEETKGSAEIRVRFKELSDEN